MTQPGRKFAQGSSGYKYGFNGKENDKDISEGGQDYGMRIYDARLGRFLSVDPLAKKYPELTPYQFASNRPLDGIDLDGLEWKKYNPNSISTIIFPAKRDKIIEHQFQCAMRSNMNVMVASTISEMNKYFTEKNKSYHRILFGGHGAWNVSGVRIGEYTYGEKDIKNYSEDIKKLGTFLDKEGAIILLACFQSTPKYSETVKESNGKQTNLNIDGEKVIKNLSKTMDKVIIANQGEGTVSDDMFEGSFVQGIVQYGQPYSNMNNKFAGHWTMTTPSGNVTDIGNIILMPDGNAKKTKEKPPVSTETIEKKP